MKQKILYILLMITTALSWSLKAEALDAYVIKYENKTLTLNGGNLNHIENNAFKYKNEEYGYFTIICPTKSISYAGGLDNGLKFGISKGDGEVPCYFGWSNSSDKYEIAKVTKVQLKTRAYGSGSNASVSINGASYQNIGNLVGGNTTVSTSANDGLPNGFSIKYKSNNGDRNPIIAEIYVEYVVAYKEPLFYFSATTECAIGGAAAVSIAQSKIQGKLGDTSASTTATFTATPSSGYEFAGWGETSDATIYESTANPYNVTLENNTPGSTVSKMLYAIFKPVFKFEVSASTNNDQLGTATASVDKKKVLGAPDDTYAQTTATFTATPANDCRFMGWYEKGDYSGAPISTETTYIFTIANNSVGSTTSQTLYALFKKQQNLQWADADLDLNLVNGHDYSSAATVTSGKTITYTSDNHNAVTIEADGTIHAVGLGDAHVTACVLGDDTYQPETITRDFSVGEIKQATFTPAWGEGISTDIKVEGSTSIALTNIADDETFTIAANPEGIISWNREGNTLTIFAVQAGTTRLTLSQQGSDILAGNTAVYNITVSKMDNTLSVTLGNTVVDVDGTITPVVSGLVSDGAIHAYISDVQLSSEVNNGTDVITYADGVITACNAGTAKIKLTQDATVKYTAYESETYTITVNKISNAISVTLDGEQKNSKNVGRGATVVMSLASTSGVTDYQFTRISGTDDIATISSTSIVSGQADGTSIWEISQAETYKYTAATTTVRVKVNSVPEEEGYVLQDLSEHSWSTISSYTPARLSGPGETLTFEASRSAAGANYFYVLYSTDGGNRWNTIANPDLSNKWQPFSYEIPENATHIKFESRTGATLSKYVRNIRVTRKTYVRATASQTNLGEVYTDKTASTTFNVSYSSTNGGDIEVLSNNPRFTVDKTAIPVANHSDNVSDPVVVTVTYTPDPDHLGDDEATITVSDRYYSAELTFTAFAKKYPTTISRGSNTATETTVDGTIDNAFAFTGTTTPAPSASSDDDFYYTIASTYSSDVHTEEGVITYDPATNTVTGRNAGKARLTIHQKSTNLYATTSQTFDFTVNKLTQTLTWDHEVETTMQVGAVIDNNTATSAEGLTPVTYTSSNTAAIEVDAESGQLRAVAVGANITITAMQAGNYKYAPATLTRQFSVFNKQTPAFTPDEAHYDSETKTITVDWEGTATITVTGVGADAAAGFTINIGDDAFVSVVRNDATITITGLTVGNTTLTLTQAASDDFLAKTETYTVNVVMPTDYLTLDPAAAPDIETGTYRKITLHRTLKEGYSTIALPFDATVEMLVGDGYNAENDWVAQLSIVAYNAYDGYSLYFKKSTEIAANEPYILHLGNPVVNPVYCGTFAVAEATATEHVAEKGVNADGLSYLDWVMHSNYTPAFDMADKYGVVNAEGVLKLGGEGSTLSAFGAYITGPSAAGGCSNQKVATRFVTDDELAGIIEQIESAAFQGTTIIYDLSGRVCPEHLSKGRTSTSANGVKIEVSTSGKLRKVLK